MNHPLNMIREEISISKNILITNHRNKNIKNTNHTTRNQTIEIKIQIKIHIHIQIKIHNQIRMIRMSTMIRMIRMIRMIMKNNHRVQNRSVNRNKSNNILLLYRMAPQMKAINNKSIMDNLKMKTTKHNNKKTKTINTHNRGIGSIMKKKPINLNNNNFLVHSKKLHQEGNSTIMNIIRRIIKYNNPKYPNYPHMHRHRVITKMKMMNNMEMTNTFMIVTAKMIMTIVMNIIIKCQK